MPEEIAKVENATVGKRTFIQRVFRIRHFLVIAGSAFIVLAVLARNIPYFQFDLSITRIIQSVSLPGFDILMVQLTNLGNTIPAGLIISALAGLLFALNKKIAALTTVVSSLGLSGLGLVIKYLVARPRPNSLLIHQLGHFVRPDSFPSGHVLQFMGCMAFYSFLSTQNSNRPT